MRLIVLVRKQFRSVKSEIRVLGVDDGRFVPHSQGTVNVVGVVYRGGYWFEGVMKTEVAIDGLDGTEKLVAMIKSSPFYEELRVVVLDGITLGGFNVVDINELSCRTNLPVISVTRQKPNLEEIKSALRNLPDFETRLQAMQNAGKLFELQTRREENAIFVHLAGVVLEDAKQILSVASTRSNVPEALRVAHIIASGLSF
jgi:endonuclease V-like protein UPF0215 family